MELFGNTLSALESTQSSFNSMVYGRNQPYVMSHLSLTAFLVSLCPWLLTVWLYVKPLLGVCWASWVYVFTKFGRFSTIILSNISSALFLLLSWNSHYMYVGILDGVLQVSEALFIFLLFIRLDNINWTIFKFMDSFCFNLILSLSTELFISVILLFNCDFQFRSFK